MMKINRSFVLVVELCWRYHVEVEANSPSRYNERKRNRIFIQPSCNHAIMNEPPGLGYVKQILKKVFVFKSTTFRRSFGSKHADDVFVFKATMLSLNIIFRSKCICFYFWLKFFISIIVMLSSGIAISGQIEIAGNGTLLISNRSSDIFTPIWRARNFTILSWIRKTLVTIVTMTQQTQKYLSQFESVRRLMYCGKSDLNEFLSYNEIFYL